MDFGSVSLTNGHRLKLLTVTDDFSRECIDITVDYGLSGEYVTRLLDRAALFRGYPGAVRADNGPEFTGRAFPGWVQRKRIRHLLIEPGKPMQDSDIESFNGKLRDECLSEQWLEALHKARTTVAAWRRDYNEARPRSNLGRYRRRSSPSSIAGSPTMLLKEQTTKRTPPTGLQPTAPQAIDW